MVIDKRSLFLLGVGLVSIIVALVFTMRAHADAPPCRYEIGQNTVVDRMTKLTWQRASGGPANHQGAIEACAELTIAGGGFRLPTIKELQTIVDVSRAMPPVIDTGAFPDVPAGASPYWSATKRASNDTEAWFVNFGDGTVLFKPTTDSLSVRCVRAP